MARRQQAGRVIAAGFSLAPGFVFPFVLSVQLSTGASDLFLLASSLIVTLASVVGSAIEVNTVVQFGRILSRDNEITDSHRRAYRKKQLLFAVHVSLVLGTIVTLIYGFRVYGQEPGIFFLVAGVCMLVPIFGSTASVRSGELIARGKSTAPVLLQSFRTIPPLVLIILLPGVHPVIVAGALCAGEIGRVVFLEVILRRMPRAVGVYDSSPLAYKGTGSQALSSATTQAGPVTDRFLLGPISGAVTAYEIADKLFYACFQFINMSLVITRLGKWSGIRAMEPAEARILLRRDIRTLCLVSIFVTASGVGIFYTASIFGVVPDAWSLGVEWACISLLAFPFAVGTFVASRFLVIAGRQNLMMRLSITVTVLTAAINWSMIYAIGPIGVPIGTALVRVFAFIVYLFVCLKVVPKIFGSDLEPRATDPLKRNRPKSSSNS